MEKIDPIAMLNKLHEGSFQQVPTETLEKVRKQVSLGCEEIIDTGARIRPLCVSDRQIGWVRGVHLSERRILHRWLLDPNEFLLEVLLLGTTLTRDQILELSSIELRSLARLLNRMQEYDLSLYPYMTAFSTTLTSEKMWHSKGTALSSYSSKKVELPGGTVMKILAPPDHSQIWSTLCTYREESKVKIENNLNALMIARAFVGSKATQSVSEELKRAAKSLQTDAIEPWKRVVKAKDTYIDDGWAHGGGDSIEELQRELKGMAENDKHEQLMEKLRQQQEEAAKTERDRIDELLRKHHKDEPIWEDAPVALSDNEVRERERQIRLTHRRLRPVVPHDDEPIPRRR